MKSYVLKLTSAVAVDGLILRAGSLVERPEAEAKNLLGRGKAVLATSDDDSGEANGSNDDVGNVSEEESNAVVEDESDAVVEVDNNTVDLYRLKKSQLVELAKANGIEGAEGLKVTELITAIEAAQQHI